jgi:hypothetical protein
MDVNWYAWEKMVDEVLPTAWRHPTRRLIGTLLIRLGRTLLGGSRGTRHDASVAVRAPGA